MMNISWALAADIQAGILAAHKEGKLGSGAEDIPVVVRHVENREHGDYASPVALPLGKKLRRAPMEIAAIIAEHMPKKEYTGKLEAAPPGFLNIRLNPGWLISRLDDVIEQDLCADTSVGGNRRINLEFISANPTGPMTLGNARTAFSVDTLANVLACAGFNVTREFYINDAGGQIRKLGQSVLRRILQAQGKKVEFSEELYQGDYIKGTAATIAEAWRENEGKEFTVEDLDDQKIVDQVSQQAMELLFAEMKHTISEDLKIDFDIWTSERALRQSGVIEQALEKLKKGGKTYEKDGTTYLKTTTYGDSEDRVLIKKDGEYAYIAPDIAYHHDKYARGFDLIFTFVGADHQGHAPKLMAAMQALGNDTSKLKVVAAQMMRFVSGGKPVKLSKRKGQIVTPKDLIAEVGYDATRFFMVQHALKSHMDFDLDLARERSERNPVYYVQYAYVRLQSIMRRAKEEGIIDALGEKIPLSSDAGLTQTVEVELMRQLFRFPEVTTSIANSFEIQGLAYYALDVAKAIHVFYKHVPVLTIDDKKIMANRLQLVVAARKVLGHTLDLLGISKPDVM